MDILTLVFIAGLGQLVLGAGSLIIPKVMKWKEALSGTPSLIRQMFYTYAGYILGINLFFGLISVVEPASLITGSFLAKSISILIFLYWLGRIIIQFTYFDRKGITSYWQKLVEIVLVGGFIFFSVVYAYAVFFNFSQ